MPEPHLLALLAVLTERVILLPARVRYACASACCRLVAEATRKPEPYIASGAVSAVVDDVYSRHVYCRSIGWATDGPT